MGVCGILVLLLYVFDVLGLYFAPLAQFLSKVIALICLGNVAQELRQFDASQLLVVVRVARLSELLSFCSLLLALVGLIHEG